MSRLPKLVRDRIPDLISERGATPHVRFLGRQEFYAGLLDKLREEMSEFELNPGLEELADLSEVLLDWVYRTLKLSEGAKRNSKQMAALNAGSFWNE
jgi:predicted house-cleaning noncanonical NTP pyrophosphatase (MazG superfamily)